MSENTNTLDNLTARQRTGSYVAIYTSLFTWGMSFAGLVPLLSLVLEGRGTSPVLIGLIAAANPIGVILAAPFVSPLVKRFGTADAMILASVGAIITVGALPFFDTVGGWFLLRFLNGLCGAVPWVATESWINSIANERSRGRITALYGSIMAAGFVVGPVLLTAIGTEGMLPFFCFTALMTVSLGPIIAVRRLAPVLHFPKGIKISGFFITLPTIMGAGFVSGSTDASMFSFLPIWGVGTGFEENTAVHLLSVFVLGSVILILPIGWIADHVNRRLILIICGLVSTIAPLVAIMMTENLWLLGGLLFVWGGCIWSMYSLGLAMLGERLQAGTLTAGNAAFVVAYEVASIVGPPASGFVMDTWNDNGLMVLLGSLAAVFTVLATARGLVRQLQASP